MLVASSICCVVREDTEDMNRERAETHLRLLAEADLRRAPALTADDLPGGRLTLVVEALSAMGAVDVGTADEILAELRLALAVRQSGEMDETSPDPRGLSLDARMQLARLMRSPPPRAATGPFTVSGLSTGPTQPASQRASWRLVPVGQVIRGRDNEVRGEMLVLAYAQTAGGARFAVAGWPFGRMFTAADDQGTRYHLVFRGEPGAGVLTLHPDPLREIRWLDFTTTSGEAATRIDLGSQGPAPDVIVTPKANSPGELLLDVIAARLLTVAAAVPQDTPEQLAAARPGLVPHAADGLGDIIAALQAAGALSLFSPVPGQLAGLCASLGASGHGITAPPAGDLPEPWRGMLTHGHRRKPHPALVPGSLVTAAVELPELDGARVAILGLHHAVDGTILHVLASGVTPEGEWAYGRGVRPLPVLWIRDGSGRWHTTRTNGFSRLGDTGEAVLWLAIVPPLDRGTAWLDVVAAGQSAEVRARLPLHWR
jgi:hypothetical protein